MTEQEPTVSLEWQVAEMILKVAHDRDKLTTRDFQGVADITASHIIELVRESDARDDAYLKEAMAEADRTLGIVPDRAAKILADRYKAGEISPLGMLATNGSVDVEGIKGELIAYYANPETNERDRQQLDYLSWWVMEIGERGPDPDWPRSLEEHTQ